MNALKIIVLALAMIISDKQYDFVVNSTADFNVATGSIRSGKTYAANMRFYEHLVNECKPGIACLLTGKTAGTAQINLVEGIKAVAEKDGAGECFVEAGVNPRYLLYKPKKIKCYILGGDDQYAKDKIMGFTAQSWLADEITLCPENFVKHADGRVSAGMRQKFATCNPENPLHYFKTEYLDKAKELNIKTWHFNLETDNPQLSKEYIKRLKLLYSGIFYDRYIRGLWVMAEGVIYENFIPARHVTEDIPKIKEYVLGVDWGYATRLAILLIGIDNDNRYYCLDELYLQNQLIDNSLKGHMTGNFAKASTFFPDPSRPEYIQQFYDVLGIDSAIVENDVNEGISEVHKCFQQREDKTCGLYIHPRCKNLLTELQNYRWKKNREGQMREEPIKENDHLCDALRYVIYSRRNYTELIDGKVESAKRDNA